RTGEGMRVEIADTGIGIEKEEQHKIFERFYPVDSSPTKANGVQGTGLGLSIARWIAERHGIDIALESTPGEGTRIRLRIPTVP
ncbi:MAG: ATP-binding protein, partial [Oscillospiraceae bacterium]|nr:ATP-binding protein [Oscillospiraceae bacterium]